MSEPHRLYQIPPRAPTPLDELERDIKAAIEHLMEIRARVAQIQVPAPAPAPGERHAYRVPEAAERLGTSPDVLYRAIRAGRIRAVKLESMTLIPHAELDRLCQQGAEK